MQKPKQLKPGDKVAIVSLSFGLLGEKSAQHQLELGVKRLQEFGLEVEFMPNALKGIEFIKNNPQARAADLKQAFLDDSINGIICAIGGYDTYKTFEFLLNDQEFINAVKNHPKVFMGYSDTTGNHLMFYQLGLTTFYGPAFLVDFAELNHEMLPYTKQEFQKMFENPEVREIKSSPIWYDERTDFSSQAMGTSRTSHQEKHGYEVLRGTGIIEGKLVGGCIDSLYSGLVGDRYDDQSQVWKNFKIFPQDWKDKILFLETSESHPDISEFRQMIQTLAKLKIFDLAAGLMVGKAQNETYYEDYKKVLLEESGSTIPIIYNLNFGHAHPKTILPYGLNAKIDFDEKRVFITEPFFE